eukprot:gb/GECH01014567.1/.p1 GENE.gb/GECH01014567.1/~~gb/GECH01014567.1/.p1  ORF type:complete len:108 (+),score=20.21 gb/GECH01014567.1/:1-324(+)
MTTKEILVRRLEQLEEKGLERTIVITELPFVIEEDDIKKHLSGCGKITNVEVKRSAALVFSCAIVEFGKKKSVKSALQKAEGQTFGGEFEVVAQSAKEFMQSTTTTS